mgnify:CR=1 FL=1
MSKEFYCAVNIDKVPGDAVGKEWEFSGDGREWVKRTLNFFYDSSHCFRTLENGMPGLSYMFMRPIQSTPVKRITLSEACQLLTKQDGSQWIENRKIESNCICVCVQVDNDGTTYFDDYNLDDLNEILKEEFNCKVVIDD